MNKIIITKKIAKQGRNSIIVIPSCLKQRIKPGNLVKVEITDLDSASPAETLRNELMEEEND